MLSKGEEQTVKIYTKARPQEWSYLTIRWLAERLLVINDECSKVHEELYKANKELANFREHYEG